MKDYGKAEEYIIMIMAGIVGKYRLARERGG